MWNLYHKEKFLEPLCFSNGKSQKDVVAEVLDAVERGKKIIFIRGVCGTGKSAIALNLARKLGKTSIVVPGKNLQNQYKKDYEEEKYLLKDGKKMQISVITGRNNHPCKFLEDKSVFIPREKKEVNSKLHDIFEGIRGGLQFKKEKDMSADNMNLPCKIEIKEKNWGKLKEYLKQNKEVNTSNLDDISDVRRVAVAGACPYWCPVMPSKYELKCFENAKKRKYLGLGGTEFTFYCRKPGCTFYEQFNSYLDSDVIVFNSLKYKLESAMNRKPLTEAEIIDECDEFLDSFSNSRNINVDRLQNSVIRAIVNSDDAKRIISEILEITKYLKRDEKIRQAADSDDILPLKATGIYDLFKILISSPEFLEDIDEENYLFDVEESARMFEDFLEDSYITVSKKDDNLILSVVTTNLAKKFQEMIAKNKRIILMSGTLHSDDVLRDIFGIDNYETIDAETQQQGQIKIQRTGLEKDCKYANFYSGVITRKQYLESLEKCVRVAKKPVLVHINAYGDLPTEKEKEEFGIRNLVSREKLGELQSRDKTGKEVDRFKKGDIDVLFSTRCARGIDFPGEQCNSIVFTKYPNPNVRDAFWRILEKTKPQHYWKFYRDKARRELWQKVYRGLRSRLDSVEVLSPDERVLQGFENNG